MNADQTALQAGVMTLRIAWPTVLAICLTLGLFSWLGTKWLSGEPLD